MDNRIAVVGLSGRFPGARSVDRFWRNLLAGVESIDRFTAEAMVAAGADPDQVETGAWVGAAGVVPGIEELDAAFFGYAAREAELLDPQQRLLLEVAWEALEDAGHPPSRFDGRIGVFAGVGIDGYLLHHVLPSRAAGGLAPGDLFLSFVANDKDFAASRISYQLDLQGPSVAVQTACSSSLVAVHLACQSLLLGESDLALAGACSLQVPQRTGYLYQEEGIDSPDGRCRAFDAAAAGTVFGDGACVVALRRLDDALADRDPIRAVVLGSAVNNDGAGKVGYTAPGFLGQVRVVAEAWALAGVPPGSASFVEAHGTGTALGDSVEVQALSRVFEGPPGARSHALGSVKTNVGHLDTAAGVTGLVKAALALHHRRLPPTLHFRSPHPRLELERTPFFVNTEALPLVPRDPETPLRAGVSSFGIGGTNAHVVLEEPPRESLTEPSRRGAQLLVVSARTDGARDRAVERLARSLEAGAPDGETSRAPELADVAWTLQAGRTAFSHRAFAIGRRGTPPADLAAGLRERAERGTVGERPPRVVFLFPGQGAQHPGMAAGLLGEPIFAAALDRADEVLRGLPGHREAPWAGRSLRSLLAAAPADRDAASLLRRTAVAQPALFAVEAALAALLSSWGIEPDLLLGHSLGEYVAAHVAGVFSFEDGLRLVAGRGRLMEALPSGEMAAVSGGRTDELAARLRPGVALAAVNGPEDGVVSGPPAALRATVADLEGAGWTCRPVHTSHAFHSPMMEPVVDAFAAELGDVALAPPRLPVLSNLTGRPLTAAEATDPGYWCRQLRETVRFSDGLASALQAPASALVELGPGHTLSALARRHPERRDDHRFLATLRHPLSRDGEAGDDREVVLRTVGRLWLTGIEPEWAALHDGERRGRVPLPTYPFERVRHWIEKPAGESASAAPELRLPAWALRASRRPGPASEGGEAPAGTWLLAGAGEGWLARLEHGLAARGGRPVRLRAVDKVDEEPEVAGAVLAPGDGSGPRAVEELALLLRRISALPATRPVTVAVVADRWLDAPGDGPAPDPDRSLLTGLMRCVGRELPHARTLSVDPGTFRPEHADRVAEAILGDLLDPGQTTAPVVAYRDRAGALRAFVPTFAELPPAAAGPPPRGAYLVVGGLGNVGLEAARALAELAREGGGEDPVHLYLTSRSGRGEERRERLRRLEALGARVHLRALDLADAAAVEAVVSEIASAHGRLGGVVHAAGRLGPETFAPVGRLGPQTWGPQRAAKVDGLRSLADALETRDVGFCLVCSSLSSHLGGVGYGAYAAANAWADAFCRERARDAGAGATRWLSVAWDGWDFPDDLAHTGGAGRGAPALTPSQGRRVFRELFARGAEVPGGEVIVSRGALAPRWRSWWELAGSASPASEVATPEAPENDHRTTPLATIWRRVLGARAVPGEGFFAQGGTSLLALQLLAGVRRELGVDLELRDLLAHPDLEALESLVGERRSAPARSASAGTADARPEPIPRAPRDRPLPLSPGQERLWLAEQDQATRGAFHVAGGFRLRGPLDVPALGRALRELATRHEALRTRFVTVAGEPRQEAPPPAPETLPALRVVEAGEDDLEEVAREEHAQPFDLAAGPPLRSLLVALGDDEHVLLLTLHHAVADDWSIGILLEELAVCYRAFADGGRPALAPLTVQYADWAAWQRSPEVERRREAEAAWWAERLAGAPTGLPVPADRPRPPRPAGAPRSYEGVRRSFRVPDELLEPVSRLCASDGVTRFMVLLGAFEVTLHALAGAEDLVVGTPVAGRDHPELAPLVGYFIRPVVIRGDLSGDPTFREVVARTRETVLEAFAHPELPADRVTAALAGGRTGPAPPLFRTWFTLLTHAAPAALGREIQVTPLDLASRPARFDLAMVLEPGPDHGIQGHVELDAELFEQATAARIETAYLRSLAAGLATPEAPLSALVTGLHDEERQRRVAALATLEERRRSSFATARRREPTHPAGTDPTPSRRSS